MPRFAIIENDEVINVIVADSKFIKEAKIKATECGDEVCVGWTRIDGEFVAPEPVIANDSETL